jgi:hypothetical protein
MNRYDEAYMTLNAIFNALLSGRLSSDARADNYVGDYMYMGPSVYGGDSFKHIDTHRTLEHDTIEQDTQIYDAGIVDGDNIWMGDGKIRLHGVGRRGRFY